MLRVTLAITACILVVVASDSTGNTGSSSGSEDDNAAMMDTPIMEMYEGSIASLYGIIRDVWPLQLSIHFRCS